MTRRFRSLGGRGPIRILRERADRIRPTFGAIEASKGPFDGFDLSDVFEYMTAAEVEAVYGRLLANAAPGARLVYWNMMAPRRVPSTLAHRVRRLDDLGRRCKRRFAQCCNFPDEGALTR